MDLRSVKYMLNMTFMFAIAAMALGSFIGGSALVFVMMGFFVAFIVIFLVFWRCPKCKKHLGKMSAQQCKRCGHNIYEQH